MPVSLLAEAGSGFDLSSITSQLSEGGLSAIQAAVPAVIPIVVAVVAVKICIKLFKHFSN